MISNINRVRRTRLAFLLGALLASSIASAQGVVTVIVPTPPGGPIDRVARVTALAIQKPLAQTIIIDNKPGAAGKIGVQAALRAPRDGHTLIAVSPSITSVNPVVDKAAGYDPLKDFDMLSIVAFNSGVIVVRADLPVKTLPELVAYADAHPGQLTYGSFGVGTSLHLQAEELLQKLGIGARHVPYKGEAQTMNAVVAGEVDMMTYVTLPIVQFVKTGRVRALAATSTKRWDALPDVPAMSEVGIPAVADYNYHSWVGLVLPAGVPAAEREPVAAALRTALASPELRAALEAQGFGPAEADAERMRSTIATELESNRRLIDAGGVKLDP